MFKSARVVLVSEVRHAYAWVFSCYDGRLSFIVIMKVDATRFIGIKSKTNSISLQLFCSIPLMYLSLL